MMATTTEPTTDRDIRCWRCQKLVFLQASRPWEFRCPKCHATNSSPKA